MNTIGYIYWGLSPEIIKLGPISIRWYGLLFAAAFVVGYYIMAKIYNDEKKTQKDLEALTITMILGTVIGARLGHCFFYEPANYLAHPLEILMVWKGGLASHGAAIGIIFSLWLYVRKRPHITLMWILDRVVIVVALSGFFIRLGNFFNSEILGSLSNSPWAVVFTRVDMLPRHPAQLYEAITYFCIFIFLYSRYLNWKSKAPQGLLFGLFLTLIFGARFILEFYKDYQVDFEKTLPLDMGQILSIPFVLVGIYFIVKALGNKEKKAGTKT